jgi:hypothetical protein
MKLKVYQTCNPSLWEATWTWEEGGTVRMVNGEGGTREEAIINLNARLPKGMEVESIA